MHARAIGDVLHFFLNCMRVLWERFVWVLLIFHKSKSRECNAYAQHWDANSTALPQSYPASIGSGGATLLEMWIIWDGTMLHYGLAGRSQNVLFNLYLIATKIEYKKINIFYIDPLPVSGTRFGNVWIFCFRLYVWFPINSNNHVMVSCSLVGAGVGLL